MTPAADAASQEAECENSPLLHEILICKVATVETAQSHTTFGTDTLTANILVFCVFQKVF